VEENPRETDRYLSALSKTPDSAGEGGSDFDLPGLLPAFFLAPSFPFLAHASSGMVVVAVPSASKARRTVLRTWSIPWPPVLRRRERHPEPEL